MKKLVRNKDFEYQRVTEKISGYTTTYNAKNYPFVESITSMLGFCDELVIVDGCSDDGTYETLEKMAAEDDRIQLYQNEFDWQEPGIDGMQKAFARALCSHPFLWQCVKPGTKIQTKSGEKNIEEILVGEEVLTHKGHFKKVLKTYKNNVSDKTICNIKKMGDNRVLSITDNHPIYFQKKDKTYVWSAMENYDKENKFVYPKLCTSNETPRYTITIPNGRWEQKIIKIKPDYKLGYLAGVFLGDGWISKNKGCHQYLQYSFNLLETETVNKVRNYIEDIFGKKTSLYEYPEKNEAKVQLGNKGVAKWFFDMFSTGSHNKKLDESIYDWDVEAIEGIFDGYLDSDGSCDDKCLKFDSVNGDMISQLKLLFTKINMFGTISQLTYRSGFSNANTEVYRLAYSGNQLCSLRENKKRLKLKNQSRQFFQENTDSFSFNAFTEIIHEQYTGVVYNLEIENDNSYVANGITVHNCDVDEVVHEDDYQKIKLITKRFPLDHDILHLPVVELWADGETVTGRRHSWKWRMSRNKPEITHGINSHARITDEETGKVYAKQGISDGCEYVHAMSYDMLPHTGFYLQNRQIEMARVSDPKAYGQVMNQVIAQLAPVYHYSWASLGRKVDQLKPGGVWDRMWSLLYKQETQDRYPGVNFDNPDEVAKLIKQLKDEGGEQSDEIKYTFKLTRKGPAIMEKWLKENT